MQMINNVSFVLTKLNQANEKSIGPSAKFQKEFNEVDILEPSISLVNKPTSVETFKYAYFSKLFFSTLFLHNSAYQANEAKCEMFHEVEVDGLGMENKGQNEPQIHGMIFIKM